MKSYLQYRYYKKFKIFQLKANVEGIGISSLQNKNAICFSEGI